MCRSGAEVPFVQKTVSASQEGALSWPGAEPHGLRSTFLPLSTFWLAIPLLRASLGAPGICSLIGWDLRCTQLLFWALGKDLVLEIPASSGKGGALANPGSGSRKWATPGASCASAPSVASPHLCMSHRPWLEGAGGKGSPLFTGHASTLPGEGDGGQNWKVGGVGEVGEVGDVGGVGEVGGVGGREGTSSLSEVTRGIPLRLRGWKLIKHPSVLTWELTRDPCHSQTGPGRG